MPITSSAKKALRKSARRRIINDSRKKNLKITIKRFKKEATPDNLSLAYQTIDKAAKVGLIKKNTAARLKSRLSQKVAVPAKN